MTTDLTPSSTKVRMVGFDARLQRVLAQVYVGVGTLTGGIAFVVTFFAVYIAAVDSVGWVIGIALGWIPAVLAGWFAYGIFRFLWPVLVVAAVVLIPKMTH
jgi:hypothetical protein